MRKCPRCNNYMTSSVKGGYGNYWLSYQCICGYTSDNDEQTVACDRTEVPKTVENPEGLEVRTEIFTEEI